MLLSWREFQSVTPYYSVLMGEPPYDGRVGVMVNTSDPDQVLTDYDFPAPSESQVNAYAFLKNEEVRLRNVVLQRLMAEYPQIKRTYVEADGNEAATLFPSIQSTEDLRELICICNVHVLPVERDRCAYIGFEFGCVWDPEHGLGIMMHRDRVVAVGQADSASMEWIAIEDDRERTSN